MRWPRRDPTITPPSPATYIAFVGYGLEQVIVGELELDGDRLTDMLSREGEYEVQDALVERLGTGGDARIQRTRVRREDLCIAAAPYPRGNPAQRLRTQAHPIHAVVGPYEVYGYLHAVPTADPMTIALRRDIIPVTEGWIAYRRGEQIVERRHDVLLVNRQHLASLSPSSPGEVGYPDKPLHADILAVS